MSNGIELTGFDELIRRLEALGDEAGEASAPALYAEANRIMTDSKTNYVPVDDGILRGSGYVAPPVVNGQDVTVDMGYGGAASDYALEQHENLNFKHPGGKQPKYLERPLMAAERGMAERMAPDIQAALERLASK